MKTFAAVLLLLAGPALAAPLSGFEPAAAPAGVQVAQAAASIRTFRDADIGYRFAYPADWTVTPADGTDNFVRLTVAPPAGNAGCTVAIAPSERFAGLTQAQLDWSIKNHSWFAEDWIDALGTRFTNVNVTSQAAVVIGRKPTRYATVRAADRKGAPNEMIMFHALSPGMTWLVACGATGSDAANAAANFKARQIEFQRVMSTFVWEEK